MSKDTTPDNDRKRKVRSSGKKKKTQTLKYHQQKFVQSKQLIIDVKQKIGASNMLSKPVILTEPPKRRRRKKNPDLPDCSTILNTTDAISHCNQSVVMDQTVMNVGVQPSLSIIHEPKNPQTTPSDKKIGEAMGTAAAAAATAALPKINEMSKIVTVNNPTLELGDGMPHNAENLSLVQKGGAQFASPSKMLENISSIRIKSERKVFNPWLNDPEKGAKKRRRRRKSIKQGAYMPGESQPLLDDNFSVLIEQNTLDSSYLNRTNTNLGASAPGSKGICGEELGGGSTVKADTSLLRKPKGLPANKERPEILSDEEGKEMEVPEEEIAAETAGA